MAKEYSNYPMKTTKKVSEESDYKDILDEIYKNIQRYYRYNEKNIERARNDREFLFYNMWTANERNAFKNLGKPIFTYNKIYDYFNKIVGEQRFNTTNIAVKSINGIVDEKALTLRADIIRGIEFKSRAEIAYQSAFADALSGGMGFIKIQTDYINANSFDQDIRIVRGEYSDRIFYDPYSTTPTKTDGNFMGESEDMSKEEFTTKHPDIPYPQSFPSGYNADYFHWGDKDKLTVCHYYKKCWYNFTLYQLSNGETISKEDYNKRKKEFDASKMQSNQPEVEEIADNMQNKELKDDQQTVSGNDVNNPTAQQSAPSMAPSSQVDAVPTMAPGIDVFPTIKNTRESSDYKIICYKAIFGRVIEEYEFPGKEFPYAMVMGNEVIIRGEKILISMVRYVKDPQRFMNFLISDIAQAAKNNRREQFLGTPGNIAGYELMWKNPSIQNSILLANPDDRTQAMPTKLPPSEISQSLVTNLQQADRDLRSIMGYPQENEPRPFGNLSGKAIREMQRDGNASNLIFFDNLKRAQEQIGRAILSMLPKIYDTERTVSAHGIDGKSSYVTINKKVAGGVMNDLTKGEFDIVVEAGANYAVQKEEALQVLMQLVKMNPEQVLPLVADIIAKNVDIEDNIELVNRLKTLVPQQAIAQANGEPAKPQPPSPQQQMAMQAQQAQQQIEQAKVQASMAKAQAAQQQAQASQGLNAVKMQQANIEMESSRIRGYSELQKAGFDYKAAMAQAAAKIAESHAKVTESHAKISDKHFEAVTKIHDLQNAPLEPIPENPSSKK